ncbi:MAG: 23S rRNA (adenine(2503)-C(2))-methyltransferase RlmN [Candidatus Omnitrophica bacterium]|nr:23S rRNA (adenine(2503)-C(2))-methyltransferase RlmN [Candidatus Omnitrophota bacterium]
MEGNRSKPLLRVPSPSLYDFTFQELTDWVVDQGQPPYRARQVFRSLYRNPPVRIPEMSDLPKEFRKLLSDSFPQEGPASVQTQRSSDGTVKHLSRLSDGQFLETVLIPSGTRQTCSEPSRRTVCVSTQVGCAYSCAFCASGQLGLKRDLTAGEIVQQILLVQRVTNVVFMGMGEPLANYENLLKAIRILNAPEGLKIGARRITISTVGLVPMIERLAKENLQVELSVSLHAPNDELRGKLMPVNRKYPLSELIPAAKAYSRATKRMITFEYILIDGVNDGEGEARQLRKLLQGLLCKVNLIPCHPTPGTPWKHPPLSRMISFEKLLRLKGIPCTLRRSRGLDIEGACGQLRLRYNQ